MIGDIFRYVRWAPARILAVLLALAVQPAHAQTGQFTNPIIPGDNALQPNMYFKDGWYYNVTHAGPAFNQIVILKSRTLEGIHYPERYSFIHTFAANHVEPWVPVMHFFNGKWYIYDSVKDTTPNPDRRVMMVWESNTSDAMGAWTYKGVLGAVSNWAYDPNVLQKSDGSLYLVYAANPLGLDQYPAHLYISAMSNPYTTSGSPVLLAKAQYWQPTDASPSGTLAWEGQLNEAAAFLTKNGKINLIYNGNSNSCACYAWGNMVNTDGNVMNPASWTKLGAPVFSQGASTVPSTGNHFFTKSPNGAEDWVVYSAWTSAAGTRGEVLAQKFTWNGDNTPNFGTPIGNAVLQNRPSGESDLAPYQNFYNAEYQTITSATIYDQTPQVGAGAMGWQSVGGLSSAGSKVFFNNVRVPMTGDYPMVIRYSNQSGATATQPIKVNGVAITSPTLPTTANWETFGNVTVSVHLNAGTNSIEFGNNAGRARIDGFQMAFQSANFAVLSGGTTEVSRSNAINGKVAGTMTTSASCVTDWRMYGLHTTNTIGIRYSAPAAASVTVKINTGSPVTVPLPSTGSTNTFGVVTLTGTLVPMSWNQIEICRASGSPEIDSYVWG